MNCVLLLTPPGAAAIAVVRLVGDQTPHFLRRHFSRPAVPGRAIHGTLADGDHVIDDPLVVAHPGGLTADLNVHGGPWVVRQVLDLAERAGFNLLGTNEIPLPPQALDGQDGIETQMLASLPAARTELSLRCLLAQPSAWRRWRRREYLLSRHAFAADRSLYWLLNPPHVAIVGAPNVGKSTIANQLFGQERSIMADMPGTTRDWVGEITEVAGVAVYLMDTPGLRDSADPIEQAAIASAAARINQANLIVLVLDTTQPIEEQRSWVQKFPAALVVRNKCDRAPGGSTLNDGASPLDAARPHLFTVANIGKGIDSLAQAIRRRFIRPWHPPHRPRLWLNQAPP